MSDFKMCPICKEYAFLVGHKCDPKWKIFHEEYLGKDFNIMYAYDYEEAAKKYAEEYDSNDYLLLNGGEITISVEPFDGRERKFFKLSGETKPVYHAREIEEKLKGDKKWKLK